MAQLTSITVTGKAGPAGTVTSQVIAGATGFSVDVGRQMLTVQSPNAVGKEFDISAATTFTVTIASTNYTASIS